MPNSAVAKKPHIFSGLKLPWKSKKQQQACSPASGWPNDEASNGSVAIQENFVNLGDSQHGYISSYTPSNNWKGSPQNGIKNFLTNDAPRLSDGSIQKPYSDPVGTTKSANERNEDEREYDRKIAANVMMKLNVRHTSKDSVLAKGKWIEENAHMYDTEERDGRIKVSEINESSSSSSSSAVFENGSSITESAFMQEDNLKAFYDKLPFGRNLDASEENLMEEFVVPQGHEEFADILRELIEKMRSNHVEKQEDAAAQLRMLTRSSVQNREVLSHRDLLDALVPLLESQSSSLQINCVVALLNLSLEKDSKIKITRAGAVPPLINVLRRGHSEAQEHAAAVIFSLALNDENKLALGVLGAISPLTSILKSKSSTLRGRKDSSMALYHLSYAKINRPKMVKAGLIPVLLSIAKDNEDELSVQAMRVLSSLASSQEGCTALFELRGISELLSIIEQTETRNEPEADKLKEHAMAALLCLSHKNLRFKPLAMQARALDILTSHKDRGTPRSQEKCSALLKILTEPVVNRGHPSAPLFDSEQYPRAYVPRDTTDSRAYIPRNLESKADARRDKAQSSFF